MNIVSNIFRSSLGKKYVMAISGLIMFLFVIGHLAGNLQIFIPDHGEAINRYGHFLQSNKELLWPVRLFLLLMLVLHIWAAVNLSAENKAARPVGYANWQPSGASYASRTMLMSGIIIFVFIIYHLLHFTVQSQAVNFISDPKLANFKDLEDSAHRHDVFSMMVAGFQNGWVSGFYILGMALLCLHLSHGISSMFQSMGWKSEAYEPFLDKAAKVIAILIFLGYTSIPVAVLMGYGATDLKQRKTAEAVQHASSTSPTSPNQRVNERRSTA